MKSHRIDLSVFDGLEGEWVDIHDRRTFGARMSAQEALQQGTRVFNLARMAAYVSGWSLPGLASDAATVEDLDDEVATYILDTAEEHYSRSRRTPAERKSAEGGTGRGNGVAGLLAGDGHGGAGDPVNTAPAGGSAVTELLAPGSA